MAQIIIDIPDASVQRVLDAFAATYGYDPIAFPEHGTRVQFAKRQVAKYIRMVTFTYEQRIAQKQAVESLPPPDEVQAT